MENGKRSVWSFNLAATIVIIGIGYFFSNFQRLVMAVLGDGVIADFGLTEAQFATLGAAIFYPYAVFQIPSGYIGDTVSARRLIFGSCLVSGLGALVFALASGYWGLVVGRALASAGTAFIYVPALAILRREFGDAHYGTAAGYFLTIGQIGSMSASTPLRILNEYVSRKVIFLFVGGISVAAAISALVLLKDSHGHAKQKLSLKLVRGVINTGILTLLLWLAISAGTYMAFLGVWGGRFFTQSLGLSSADASMCLMMFSVGSLIGSVAGGRLGDRFGSLRVLLVCGTLRALMWFVTGMLPEGTGMATAAFVTFVSGFFHISASTSAFSSVKYFVPPSQTGLASGTINTAIFITTGLLTQLSGPIMGMAGGSMHDQFLFLLSVFGSMLVGATAVVAVINRRIIVSGKAD